MAVVDVTVLGRDTLQELRELRCAPEANFIFHTIYHPYYPWYIYLHGWLIFMVNVGKYTSPMDPMGHGSF